MKILTYQAGGEPDKELQFPKIEFSQINLVVGDSGTGKTRLLNTIFNAGRIAVRKEDFFTGWWDIVFEHNDVKYKWYLSTYNGDNKKEKNTIYIMNDTNLPVWVIILGLHE